MSRWTIISALLLAGGAALLRAECDGVVARATLTGIAVLGASVLTFSFLRIVAGDEGQADRELGSD